MKILKTAEELRLANALRQKRWAMNNPEKIKEKSRINYLKKLEKKGMN